MLSAIRQIVDAYVRLKDRQALQNLLAHRQRIAVGMKDKDSPAFRQLTGLVDEEIAVILDGLSMLDCPSECDSAGQSEPTE